MSTYDMIVVGSGLAGATMAYKSAEDGKKVLVIEKRDHIGGNCHDYYRDGVLIHAYGPHIFHTDDAEVFAFLKSFTPFEKYEHRVLGHIDGQLVPIPFNLTSLESCFSQEESRQIKAKLKTLYPDHERLTITELRKAEDPLIQKLADFVFEKVFKYYTMKQWGQTAEELSEEVIGRVPVNLTYDDRYFKDHYQALPVKGYHDLFEKMLDHDNITVLLNTDAKSLLHLDLEEKKIYFQDELFTGYVVYTGALDELLDHRLGVLPYRSLDLVLEKHRGIFQKGACENYPDREHPFTRITEYCHLQGIDPKDSYIHIEYPMAYDPNAAKGNIPYYPIIDEANVALHQKYLELLKAFKNFIPLGRLAEYRYYNMDAIVKRTLKVHESLL